MKRYDELNITMCEAQLYLEYDWVHYELFSDGFVNQSKLPLEGSQVRSYEELMCMRH